MLVRRFRPVYTVYCNKLMSLQQIVATIDRKEDFL